MPAARPPLHAAARASHAAPDLLHRNGWPHCAYSAPSRKLAARPPLHTAARASHATPSPPYRAGWPHCALSAPPCESGGEAGRVREGAPPRSAGELQRRGIQRAGASRGEGAPPCLGERERVGGREERRGQRRCEGEKGLLRERGSAGRGQCASQGGGKGGVMLSFATKGARV
ncbi:hypothetical protein SEVIR_4G030250v4 [Setaria viridis]